jgi:hypothetical protein
MIFPRFADPDISQSSLLLTHLLIAKALYFHWNVSRELFFEAIQADIQEKQIEAQIIASVELYFDHHAPHRSGNTLSIWRSACNRSTLLWQRIGDAATSTMAVPDPNRHTCTGSSNRESKPAISTLCL